MEVDRYGMGPEIRSLRLAASLSLTRSLKRGANAPRPGQRGANAPRLGQRGAITQAEAESS
eukprot:jgi/Tetstr1/423688/TSEL_014322.t1